MSNNTHKNLSDSEWELMKELWQLEPVPANRLAERLPQWHSKTVRTMLLRLQKKSVVSHTMEEGVQHFSAELSREECERQATDSFVQRVFNGALSPMVAHFTRQHDLSPEDREALLTILEKATKKEQ